MAILGGAAVSKNPSMSPLLLGSLASLLLGVRHMPLLPVTHALLRHRHSLHAESLAVACTCFRQYSKLEMVLNGGCVC